MPGAIARARSWSAVARGFSRRTFRCGAVVTRPRSTVRTSMEERSTHSIVLFFGGTEPRSASSRSVPTKVVPGTRPGTSPPGPTSTVSTRPGTSCGTLTGSTAALNRGGANSTCSHCSTSAFDRWVAAATSSPKFSSVRCTARRHTAARCSFPSNASDQARAYRSSHPRAASDITQSVRVR